MIVHQDAAQVGFLQSAVEDDAPGNTLQFHNGCAHHERDVPGTIHREDSIIAIAFENKGSRAFMGVRSGV